MEKLPLPFCVLKFLHLLSKRTKKLQKESKEEKMHEI